VYTASKTVRPRPGLTKLLGGINNNSIHGWLHRLPAGNGSGRKLLDVGCSSGEKLQTFRKRGFEVFGVDMAADAIKRANDRFGDGFSCGKLEDVHYESDSFDVVRIDNTLEHIQKPKELLQEIRRILRPGGLLLVYVPNGESLTMHLLKGYSINSWIPFHIALYSPKTLRSLLSEAGFAEVRTLSHAPPALLLSSVSQLLGKHKAVDLGIAGQLLSAWMLPATLVLSLLPRGEEVVGFAKKPL